MNLKLSDIELFLKEKNIAVAGISRNSNKFGNMTYKALKDKGYKVFPINPNMDVFDNQKCYKSIEELPEEVKSILICTKPEFTEKIVEQIILQKNISHIWLQQGSENKKTIEIILENNVNLISKKCIFMFLPPVVGVHKFHQFFSKLLGSYPRI